MTQDAVKAGELHIQIETFSPRQKQLLPIAKECVEQGAKFADRFRKVCVFIRENEIGPAEATPVLLAAGFTKQRASDLRNIAFLGDEPFKQYEAGQIGWKPALEKAREANRAKKGRKQQKRSAFPRYMKLHHQLAKKHPKCDGLSVTNNSICLVHPLKSGEHSITHGTVTVTFTIAIKTPTAGSK